MGLGRLTDHESREELLQRMGQVKYAIRRAILAPSNSMDGRGTGVKFGVDYIELRVD